MPHEAITNRRFILREIKRALEGITKARGYGTDVGTVESVVRPWNEAYRKPLPWVGFAPMRQPTPSPEPFGRYRWRMPVTVIIHTTGSGADQLAAHEAAHEALDTLMDDVIAAMQEDPSWCGRAILTHLTGYDTTDGDAEALELKAPLASGRLDFEIAYERTIRRAVEEP